MQFLCLTSGVIANNTTPPPPPPHHTTHNWSQLSVSHWKQLLFFYTVMNNTPIRTSTNGSRRLFKSMRIMHRWCWSSSEGCETPSGGRESSVGDFVPSALGPQTSLWPPAPRCVNPVPSSPEKAQHLAAHTLGFCNHSTSHTSLQPPGLIPLRRSHSISQISLYSFALNWVIHWTTQDWTVTTLSLYSCHQTECDNYSSNEN